MMMRKGSFFVRASKVAFNRSSIVAGGAVLPSPGHPALTNYRRSLMTANTLISGLVEFGMEKVGRTMYDKVYKFWNGPPKPVKREVSYPRRVFTPSGFALVVNVPGFKKENLKITIHNRIVNIQGESKDLCGGDLMHDETLNLTEDFLFDPKAITAQCTKGQLMILIPVTLEKRHRINGELQHVRWV